MVGSTALSYQMMYEGALLNAALDAAKADRFHIAKSYAEDIAIIMGITPEQFPEVPHLVKTQRDFIAGWERYYVDLMKVICKSVNVTLNRVRNDYGSKFKVPKVIDS